MHAIDKTNKKCLYTFLSRYFFLFPFFFQHFIPNIGGEGGGTKKKKHTHISYVHVETVIMGFIIWKTVALFLFCKYANYFFISLYFVCSFFFVSFTLMYLIWVPLEILYKYLGLYEIPV